MFKKWFVWFGCCALAGGVAAVAGMRLQGTPASKPGPEHAALTQLVGTWKVDATLEPGPWGRGGRISSTQDCRLFEAFHLICDSDGVDVLGPSKSHAMYSYYPPWKKYVYVDFSNSQNSEHGGLYPEQGVGKYDGTTWTWVSVVYVDGKKIPARSTLTENSPTRRTFARKISRDDGKTWTTIIEGKWLRQDRQ